MQKIIKKVNTIRNNFKNCIPYNNFIILYSLLDYREKTFTKHSVY